MLAQRRRRWAKIYGFYTDLIFSGASSTVNQRYTNIDSTYCVCLPCKAKRQYLFTALSSSFEYLCYGYTAINSNILILSTRGPSLNARI